MDEYPENSLYNTIAETLEVFSDAIGLANEAKLLIIQFNAVYHNELDHQVDLSNILTNIDDTFSAIIWTFSRFNTLYKVFCEAITPEELELAGMEMTVLFTYGTSKESRCQLMCNEFVGHVTRYTQMIYDKRFDIVKWLEWCDLEFGCLPEETSQIIQNLELINRKLVDARLRLLSIR